jgi:hypothetical protein
MTKSIKLLVLSLLVFCNLNHVFAQDSPIKVSYKVNANKDVDFNYEKTDPGSFTVVLNFKSFSNTNIHQQEFTVKNYSGNLLTLTPLNKEQNIGFSFTSSAIRGKLNPELDADFVYLLPAKTGTRIKVLEARFFSAKYFGATTPDDWKTYYFIYQNEDTVTAIRKGIVVSIKEEAQESENSSEIAYTNKTNSIMIEHADGTLARYNGFKKESISVKPGQTVFPGSRLGLNSKSNANNKYGISLAITYLKSTDFDGRRAQNLKNSKSLYGFVTPHFHTSENASHILVAQQEYTAATTPAIIQKELSKKELKQIAKK